ncbi:MAG: alpha/beta hydrolase [Methanotrichaceae archaeon]|nr:alpha/beta hydrolase [Methanotrichaceae archaeon]
MAKYSLGYASITFDQRNSGVADIRNDYQPFMNSKEPTEYKMVHDALVAAEILRDQPEIDPNRIAYAGESNGGRFATIACALDPMAHGAIAISSCGYGIDAMIRPGKLNDLNTIRFYRSIDPDTYLSLIPPREFIMIHSLKDPIIPFEYANQTYAMAYDPKSLQIVECDKHGYCTEMNAFLEKDLTNVFS